MNRILIILLTFSSLLTKTSCTQSSKTVKVGFLLPNLVGERYQKEQAYFNARFSALGGEALFASADNDDRLQIQQAREMIEKGAEVLVVNSVNMHTAAAIVRDAHEKNVRVIAYDRLIRNCDLDYYISFDNIMIGKMMAGYVTRLKPEGTYILLGGDKSDMTAEMVKNGQMEVLSRFVNEGKIKIDYNIYVEDWSSDNAYLETRRYLDLSGKVPDVILTSNDEMARGAAKALSEQDLSGVLLTGQDAELQSCRNIVNDLQAMTVYIPLKVLAEKAAEIAFKMASGQAIEEHGQTINNGSWNVPSIFLDPVLVDKNNMRSTIIADGFYTENQIYGQ